MIKNKQEKELQEFSEALEKFIVSQKQKNPLLVGAVLMKTAMEIYAHNLNDDAIYSLLNVVANSVSEIRNQVPRNTTVH
jgi:hypothetical protein